MKAFDELTPRQQFLRQTIAKILIDGPFVLGSSWGIYRVVKWQEEDNASAQRIEATMMDYYRETKHQPDTVGMASYMKQRLSPVEYELWLEAGR